MRTLGVLGGMGPAATAEFLRLLSAAAPADTDQEHPRLLLLSDPGVPERTAAILADDGAPRRHIHNGLHQLASWGADLLAMPCNTAHAFVDEALLPVPLVHIVDATLGLARGGGAHRAWLAASSGTMASGLYQRRARQVGYDLLLPDPEIQAAVHGTSVLVKANRLDEAGRLFATAVRAMWHRAQAPVLAACTELPLAYTSAGLPPERMVSSLDALAEACVAAIYDGTPQRRSVTGAAVLDG